MGERCSTTTRISLPVRVQVRIERDRAGEGRTPGCGDSRRHLICSRLAATLPGVELIDLPDFGPDDFAQITAGASDPFGTDHLGIVWQEKTDHVGLIDEGQLIGHAGWIASRVRAADGQVVEVLGLGGVMIHGDRRGRGVGGVLVRGTMEKMRASGGSLAMLFCRPERLSFYGRLGWLPIRDEVTVEQPDGTIVMPLCTCWTALVEGESMPAGGLHLEGLPF